MFRTQMILKSVLRHRRRNLVYCLLLAVVLSVPFCAFLYADFAAKETERMEDLYNCRYSIRFRDELQYDPEHPKWSAFEEILNGTSATDGEPDVFFDSSEMAEYARPYSVSREVFEVLGNKEYCSGYALAYADTAYGFAQDLPDEIQANLDTFYSLQGSAESPRKMCTEHIVIGGSLDAFTGLSREYDRYLYDFHLREGREPAAEECVITDFYAKIYGLEVGDILTLYDLYGSPIRELTVSGIYTVYMTEFYEGTDPAVPESGRAVTGASLLEDFGGAPDFGTPFDRLCEDMEAFRYRQEHYKGEYYCVSGAMLSLIHTDLETAYTLYSIPKTEPAGENRHHINQYFVYYDLKDPSWGSVFAGEAAELLPEDWRGQFTAVSFQRSLQDYRKIPVSLASDANLLMRFFIPLAIGISVLVSVVLVRENGRETGIFLGVGVSGKDTILCSAAENTIVTAAALLFSVCGGGGIHLLLRRDFPFLQMAELSYQIPSAGWMFALGILVFVFVVTAVFTALYIRIHTPIRLIRQE